MHKVLERIGVVGDIHAQDERLEVTLEFLRKEAVPIMCTGDVVDGKGDVHKCISLLEEAGVETVLGNHDEWMLQNIMRDLTVEGSDGDDTMHTTTLADLSGPEIRFMRSLPKTMSFLSACGNILLCHGVGENTMNKINPDDYGYAIEFNDDLQKIISEKRYKIMINGHSHKKMIKEIKGLVILNAGSLTREPGFLIVDFKERVVHFHVLSGWTSKIERSVSF